MERAQLITLMGRLAEAQVLTADPKRRTIPHYQEGTFKGKQLERFLATHTVICESIDRFMTELGVDWSLSTEFPDQTAGNKSGEISYAVNYSTPTEIETSASERQEFSFQYNPGRWGEVIGIKSPVRVLSKDRQWRTDPISIVLEMEDLQSKDWYVTPVHSFKVTPEVIEAIMKIAILNSRKVC